MNNVITHTRAALRVILEADTETGEVIDRFVGRYGQRVADRLVELEKENRHSEYTLNTLMMDVYLWAEKDGQRVEPAFVVVMVGTIVLLINKPQLISPLPAAEPQPGGEPVNTTGDDMKTPEPKPEGTGGEPAQQTNAGQGEQSAAEGIDTEAEENGEGAEANTAA